MINLDAIESGRLYRTQTPFVSIDIHHCLALLVILPMIRVSLTDSNEDSQSVTGSARDDGACHAPELASKS